MVSLFLGLFAFTVSATLSVAADSEASARVPQLTLLKTIPIGGSNGCKSQKMVVLDSTSGKVLAAVAIGSGVDLTDRPGAAPGVVYDPALGVAMSANGRDGTMSVVKETSAGDFEAVQTPKTIKGALTVTVDTKMHHALLPCNIPDGKGGVTFGIAVVGVKEADNNVR